MLKCLVALACISFGAVQCIRLCPRDMFQCLDGLCLNRHQVCDGLGDCDGNEDESYEFARCGSCGVRDQRRAGYRCRKACTNDSQCSGSLKRCACDGHCGKSCFNPKANCSAQPPTAEGMTGFSVFRFHDHLLQEVRSGGYHPGDIVNYHCPPGMVTIGPEITCTSRRQWTQAEVFCAIHCQSDEEEVRNYNLSCGERCMRHRDCPSNQSCMCDGPCGRTCVDPNVNCSAAASRPHSRVEYIGEGINQTANYLCDDGYFLETGDTSHQCSGSGLWYGDPVTCREIFCGDPARNLDDRHLVLVSGARESYPVNSSVQFRCAEGYWLRGAANRTCMDDGRWSGIVTACQRNGARDRCPDPGWPVHGRRLGNDFSEGQVVTYECDPFYVMSGEASQVCQWTREWTGGGAPECLDPRYPENLGDSLRKLASGMSSIAPRSRGFGRSISTTDISGHEIAFIFDASISIKDQPFWYAIQFAKNLVKRLSGYKHGINYAIIVFASESRIKIRLSEKPTNEEVLDMLETIEKNRRSGLLKKEIRGNTATDAALRMLRAELAPSYKNNNATKRHCFLFTDGMHNEGPNPLNTVNSMMNQFRGVFELYTVTACTKCNKLSRDAQAAIKELETLATKPENFIYIKNYYSLNQILDGVANFTIDLTKCGQAGDTGSLVRTQGFARVIGGKAIDHAWPWQATIMEYTKGLDIYTTFQKDVFGGGSLINKEWVLTAAHVFDNYEDVNQRLDELAVAVGLFRKPKRGRNLDPTVEMFKPRKIYIHRLFNRDEREDRRNFDYDIALIRIGAAIRTVRDGKDWIFKKRRPKFNGTIPLSPYIRPVCLPCSNSCMPIENIVDDNGNRIINDDDPAEVVCRKKGDWLVGRSPVDHEVAVVVTGYGISNYTKFNGRVYPNNLQQTTLVMESDASCDTSRDEFEPTYSRGIICARHKNRRADACQGDSGGPLVRKYTNPNDGDTCWIQVGVVSFGEHCDKQQRNGFSFPGYYTEVAYMQSWIDDIVSRHTG